MLFPKRETLINEYGTDTRIEKIAVRFIAQKVYEISLILCEMVLCRTLVGTQSSSTDTWQMKVRVASFVFLPISITFFVYRQWCTRIRTEKVS